MGNKFRDWRHIAAFLLLASLSYADCVGYNETFGVQVVDAEYRSMPGAAVTVTYDPGTSFGERYFTTQPVYTDATGLARFTIYNQGTNTRSIDCKIWVNGSIGGARGSVTVTANEHADPVTIRLIDVYPLRFFIRDHLGYPLPNASVSVGGKSVKSGADGIADLYLKTGKYNYLASYLDAKQAGTLTVSNATVYEVVFTYYKVQVDVVDDSGTPLPAGLTIFNRTFELQDGHFESNKTFGEAIPYSTDYKGLIISGTIIPATNPNARAVYDIHAPTFGEIKPETLNERQRLDITVSDNGQYASGLDLGTMKVTYKVEPSDENAQWNDAVVFTAGRNRFTAEFPELPQNAIVRFRTEIKDKAGNRAEIEGKFTTYEVQAPQNTTQNQTNPQQTTPQEQGIPLTYILGGAIIAILAVYMVFRIKSKTT